MSVEQTQATMNDYVDTLVKRGDYARYFSDDVTWVTVGPNQELRGRDAVGQFIRWFHEQAFDAAGGNSTLQGGAVFPRVSDANPDWAGTPAQVAGGPATASDFGVVSAPGVPAAGAISHNGANVISAGILLHTAVLAG